MGHEQAGAGAGTGKLLIGTNWKMHKSLAAGKAYSRELMDIASELHPGVELFVIPPYTALHPLRELLGGSRIKLGAQNMHWLDEGAFTGEISPMMLAELGLDLVELGHSERRQHYNENDGDINKKVHAALKHGLTPLVCIGENLAQKQAGVTAETLAMQLKVCLGGLTPGQAACVWVAYEPVWAIGASGVPAEAAYVGEVHAHIRAVAAGLFGEAGAALPLLYGGSVNTDNFESYLDCSDVNGLFIGRAAWDIDSFRTILRTVSVRLEAAQ